MAVDLLDPATMQDRDRPAGSEAVRAFVEAICRHGSERLASNVRTRAMVLRDSDVALPVTINETENENSYVCSNLTYSQYMRDELKLIRSPALQAAMARVLDGAGAVMRQVQLNKVAQVNNWLAATNPYPADWPPNLASITDALVTAFPDHYISFRSLNEWANQATLKKLKASGYKLAAFRQIYVYDRLPETYLTRHQVKMDHKLLRGTKYRVVGNDEFAESDYPRMAEIYGMLYLQKHSIFNPAFTADYMRLCHTSGILRFLGLRHPSGRLDGMVGILAIGRTTPLPSIVGYDTSLDRYIGLYRMIITLIFKTAMAEGWNVNLSSGAAEFKRKRGGQPIIEYSSLYDRHLSRTRQFVLSALAGAANIIGVRLMKRFNV
jgi:hypothetical protein